MTESIAAQLAGGLRVVTERVDSASSVCLGVAVAVGSRDESPAEAGYCHFLEHLLFRGTASTTARQISVAFDSMGGVIDAMTSRESTMLTVRVAPDDAEPALELLLEMIAQPTLAEVDTERRVILEEMAMIEDDHADRLGEALSARVHGGDPLGSPIAGSRQSVSEATRDRLAVFHRSAYCQARIVAVAAGRIDHEWFLETVGSKLGGLAEGERAERTAPEPVPGSSEHLDLPGEQVHVQLAGLGPGRETDERFTLAAMSTVLGESSSSRLFTELRENRGLAYDTGSYTAPAVGASEVGVYISTGVDTAPEAARVLGSELRRFRQEGPTAEEVELAKRQMKARVLLARESMSDRAGSLASALLAERDPLGLADVLGRIDSVTAAGVGEMAERVFDPGTLHSGSAGPGADVAAAALESAGSGSLSA